MKITIELTDAQAKGIKSYLRDVGSIANPTKKDVQEEVNAIVQSYLQAQQSAVTDYILQHEHLE
jgi:hypothetical protein